MASTKSKVASFAAFDIDTYSGPFAKTIRALLAKDGSEWDVADSLFSEVNRDGKGNVPGSEWDRLGKALESTGTPFRPESLRAYYRAASFWPKAKRVGGVSFTAHRRAMSMGDVTKARAIIGNVLKANGNNPNAVTDRATKAAVDSALGKVPKARAKAQSGTHASPTPADPITAAMQALNALTGEVLLANAERLPQLAKVLGATVNRVTQVQSRQTAKVVTPKTKATPKAKAKVTANTAKAKAQPVGMR